LEETSMANRDLTPWRTQGLTPMGRDPFNLFRREMDRLFDDIFAPAEPRSFAAPAQAGSAAAMWPSIDMHETDQAYIVSAELPGIDQKDIELNLNENALTISGEKRSERREEDKGRRYSERSFGRFERTIPFDVEVDADRVEATCENGVLKVTLPKNMQARDKARRIEIKPQGASAAGAQQPQAQGQAGSAQAGAAQTGSAMGGQAPGAGGS
jgi:HSP20 family protein